MTRSGLFWTTLLPMVALIAVAIIVAADEGLSFNVKAAVFAVVLLSAVVHARWTAQRLFDRAEANRADLATATPATSADPLALLEVVLRSMLEGVVVLDAQQRVLFANEASRPMLDIQTRDIASRPLWEVARLAAVNEAVERALSGVEREQFEFEVPRRQLIVAVTVTPLPRDPVPGVLLVLHDMTELRRLERMRREFVSNVSHELKTPLTSIQAYADTLVDDDFSDPDQTHHFLSKIVEQSERLGALIVDIIRLGKVESQSDVSDVRPVDVRAVIAACIDAHADLAATKGIALAAKPGEQNVTVLADPGELRTILDNLVDNALHYTPDGGRVTVRVIEADAGGASDPTPIGICVVDTGIGIPKDQQPRIFERFYRVDRARDRQRGGTGLGLSIVKHLAQQFGGRIEVHSELGVGTTFTVWLPAGSERENVAAASAVSEMS